MEARSLTVGFIAIVSAYGICKCDICAAKEPCEICQFVDGWVATEAVGKAEIIRVAASGVFPWRMAV